MGNLGEIEFLKMRLTAAILLSISLLLSPAAELLKIPALISHFQKHRIESGITIIDFLAEHYDTTHNDSDFPDDKKLPFMSDAAINITAIIPIAFTPVHFQEYVIRSDRNHYSFLPLINGTGIFRPPRDMQYLS